MFKAIPDISKKILIVSIGVLLVVSMVFFVSPGKIYGANLTVGSGGYATIQLAINAANPGDTIVVTAGTYVENVNVNKVVTIQGAGASTTILDANNTGHGFNVTTDNAVIDGFEIINAKDASQHYAGVFIGGVRGVEVKNCTIHNSQIGIYLLETGAGGTANNINNNVIYDIKKLRADENDGIGIIFWGLNSGNQISSNYVYSCDRFGIFIGWDDNTKMSSGNQLLDNTIHDNGKNTLADGAGIGFSPASGNTIQGNEIYNHTTATSWYQAAIQMQKQSCNNLIKGNKIHGNKLGIALYDDANILTGNQINDNNVITGNSRGIIIYESSVSTIINNNNIYGNTRVDTLIPTNFEVKNNGTSIVDATNNWWGSVNPDFGSIVSGTVNYTPWLTNPVGYIAPAPAPTPPLTDEQIASLDLSIAEQVNSYGASNTGFTKMLYDNILGRAAESEGLSSWATDLNDGKITLGSVVYNFVFSKELEPIISPASPEDFITFLYKNVLNREQDSEGYDGWLSAMQNGMTKEEVLLHFIDSGEFKNICEMFGLKP